MSELIQCRKVAGIVFQDDGELHVGRNGCKEMQISMEDGQMSGVPWVREIRDDGTMRLHNCALLQMVILADSQQPDRF